MEDLTPCFDLDLDDLDLDLEGFCLDGPARPPVIDNDLVTVPRYHRHPPESVRYERAAEFAAAMPDRQAQNRHIRAKIAPSNRIPPPIATNRPPPKR